MTRDWDATQIPDQRGRLAVVTGANSGLGRATATELARHGAEVVLAVRNTEAGEQAAAGIRAEVPGAAVEVRRLDLASLASVRAFADSFLAEHAAVDLLINNAGLVVLDDPGRTSDGFELHFGTNHLGHFALTGLLLPVVTGRVVSLSSITHKGKRLDPDTTKSASTAYGISKLATTVFGLELNRRLTAAGSPVLSVLAHPGMTVTNLTPRGLAGKGWLIRQIGKLNPLWVAPLRTGVLPQLYAATAPDVRGGQFFGPAGFMEIRGPVTEVRPSDEASDPAVGQRLWTLSEEMTGVRPVIGSASPG
jgi:NAD(P)-dependent dehydrogenase (short-subunit alcohol dehydrogenase family)